jgi:hypothetical protein
MDSKTKMMVGSVAAFGLPASLLAGPVTVPYLETFDSPASSQMTLTFEDINNNASASGSGVGPGFTVTGGELAFFNDSDFFDVAAANVVPSLPAAVASFAVSADFDIDTIDFNNGLIGIYALAVNPTVFDRDFSGIYAYVRQNGFVSGDYQLVIENNDDIIATSSIFDLTDGTPNFNLSLTGAFDAAGDLDVTAIFSDDGGENVIVPLLATVDQADQLVGGNFGIRVSPQANPTEFTVDNFALNAVPVPEPTSLAAVGLASLLGLRRRR